MRSSRTSQIGNAGLTKAVIAEVDRALAAHELIKVKIQGDDRELREAIGDEICASRPTPQRCNGVGKVMVLWRPRAEKEKAD